MQTLISIGLFVVFIALIPVGLKWVQRRAVANAGNVGSASRIISTIAVGPHQRIITIEVGPESERSWLTLGVTAQTITCLHCTSIKTSALVESHQAAPTQMTTTMRL